MFRLGEIFQHYNWRAAFFFLSTCSYATGAVDENEGCIFLRDVCCIRGISDHYYRLAPSPQPYIFPIHLIKHLLARVARNISRNICKDEKNLLGVTHFQLYPKLFIAYGGEGVNPRSTSTVTFWAAKDGSKACCLHQTVDLEHLRAIVVGLAVSSETVP